MQALPVRYADSEVCMKSLGVLLVLSSLVCSPALAGELYRWVDAHGRVTYSDQPPPPDARAAEKKSLTESVVGGKELSYTTRLAVENFPVTLYRGAKQDEWSDKATQFLTERGIPFTTKVVANEEDHQAFKQSTGGKAELFPTLVVGSEVFSGYETAAWTNLLDRAGYPPAKAPSSASSSQTANAPAER